MQYVEIPKDFTAIKTKVAFNLTKRQLICFTLAALVGIPVYLVIRKFCSNDIALMVMVAVMLPFFMLAFYEKDGQPLEKLLIRYIRFRQSPKIRVYQTQNMYSFLKSMEAVRKGVTDIGGNKPGTKKQEKTNARTGNQGNRVKKKPKGVKKYKNDHSTNISHK